MWSSHGKVATHMAGLCVGQQAGVCSVHKHAWHARPEDQSVTKCRGIGVVCVVLERLQGGTMAVTEVSKYVSVSFTTWCHRPSEASWNLTMPCTCTSRTKRVTLL